MWLNSTRSELRKAVSVRAGIGEAFTKIPSLSFLAAISDTMDEAKAEHERQTALAALDEQPEPEFAEAM